MTRAKASMVLIALSFLGGCVADPYYPYRPYYGESVIVYYRDHGYGGGHWRHRDYHDHRRR